MNLKKHCAFWLILLSMLGVVGSGCQSTNDKPASASFASVVIQGNTPGQISEATIQVFQEHGYKLARPGVYHMVFEKEGSAMSNFTYGNWMGESVWIRVRVAVEQIAEGSCRLSCNAYMLRDRGGSTEEEIKLSGLKSGPYKKMLKEVAARFTKPAP